MRDHQRERKRDGRGWQKGQTGWERQRHRKGISGVVLGLRLVCVADGYLWIPVHCGIGCWTGSECDVSLRAGNRGHGCEVDFRLLSMCPSKAV